MRRTAPKCQKTLDSPIAQGQRQAEAHPGSRGLSSWIVASIVFRSSEAQATRKTACQGWKTSVSSQRLLVPTTGIASI